MKTIPKTVVFALAVLLGLAAVAAEAVGTEADVQRLVDSSVGREADFIPDIMARVP